MSEYSFTTHWSFDAPLDAVWEAISQPLRWPEWWPGVERVVEIERAGRDGLGAVHRSTWKSALPYRLTFDSRVMRVEPLRLYEIRATGQLEGRGIGTLSSEGRTTHVRYDWNVAGNERWMRLLGPVARPVFRWNHDVIMRWGQRGWAARIAATNRAGPTGPSPDTSRR
jgi:hypothetical protein